jgi:hypothetical protein
MPSLARDYERRFIHDLIKDRRFNREDMNENIIMYYVQ